MNLPGKLPVILTAILFMTPLMMSIALAGTSENQENSFVDLDGDGFNDNAIDNNADGIPDDPNEQIDTVPSDDSSESTGFVNFDAGFSNSQVTPHTNSEKFARLSFTTRALGTNRGGFGAGDDFGPGNGIGIGAISAGGCSGGVCRP